MMRHKILTYLNVLIVLTIIIVFGFFSAVLYIGTPSQHEVLIKNFPDNFLPRFLSFWVAGLILLGLLALIDLAFNKTLLKDHPLKIKTVFFGGLIAHTVICLLGSLYFFRVF